MNNKILKAPEFGGYPIIYEKIYAKIIITCKQVL